MPNPTRPWDDGPWAGLCKMRIPWACRTLPGCTWHEGLILKRTRSCQYSSVPAPRKSRGSHCGMNNMKRLSWFFFRVESDLQSTKDQRINEMTDRAHPSIISWILGELSAAYTKYECNVNLPTPAIRDTWGYLANFKRQVNGVLAHCIYTYVDMSSFVFVSVSLIMLQIWTRRDLTSSRRRDQIKKPKSVFVSVKPA